MTTHFLASVDPGNQNFDVAYAKVTTQDGKFSTGKPTYKTIPSLVADDVDEYTFSQTDLVDGSGDVTTRQFGVGDYPEARWIKDSVEGKAYWVLPVLIHSMWKDLKDGDTITVYTSVHNVEAFKDQMKAALNGVFIFIKDDEEKKVTVKCDRILIEGVGSMFLQKPESKNNILLDLGGQTVMIAPYSGLKLMSGCSQPYQLPHQGTSKLISEFAKCAAVSKTFKTVLTYQEARSVIDDPKHTFKGHDFSEAVKAEVAKWLDRTVPDIESEAKSHLKDAAKFATGGACLIPEVQEWLIAHDYIPVRDALHGNVKGVFEIAKALEVKNA